MTLPPSSPILFLYKLSKRANQCQIMKVAFRGRLKLDRGPGTTGGLLEVLERCVGFEGFSDGFAAHGADFVVLQAVETGELVSNSKGRPPWGINTR